MGRHRELIRKCNPVFLHTQRCFTIDSGSVHSEGIGVQMNLNNRRSYITQLDCVSIFSGED